MDRFYSLDFIVPFERAHFKLPKKTLNLEIELSKPKLCCVEVLVYFNYFTQGSDIVHLVDQDSTDFSKTLKHLFLQRKQGAVKQVSDVLLTQTS